MPIVFRQAVPKKDIRIDVSLVGAINGVNQTFTIPETFVQDPPNLQITVYYNGVRQKVNDDYTVSLLSSSGSADRIDLFFAPLPGDSLTADYVVST